MIYRWLLAALAVCKLVSLKDRGFSNLFKTPWKHLGNLENSAGYIWNLCVPRPLWNLHRIVQAETVKQRSLRSCDQHRRSPNLCLKRLSHNPYLGLSKLVVPQIYYRLDNTEIILKCNVHNPPVPPFWINLPFIHRIIHLPVSRSQMILVLQWSPGWL